MYYYFVFLNTHGCELATSEKYPMATETAMTANMVKWISEEVVICDVGDHIEVRETDWNEEAADAAQVEAYETAKSFQDME